MTAAPVNRRIVLARRPQGAPAPEDFRLEEVPVPAPAAGQVLLRTRFLSLDPYMRGRMSDAPSYVPPVALGAPMAAQTVSVVEASQNAAFKVGELVVANVGWQDYGVSDGRDLVKIDPALERPSYALGVLGMPGLTAYVGLLDIGEPKAGETVVVGAATGAVGSVVGQIAKLKGCRVIGTAGAPDKVAYVKDALGFDAAIDYKGKNAESLGAELAALAPNGIDVFFDNVGGPVHDAAMVNLALHGRVIIVGSISIYNRLETPDTGIRWNRQLLVKRARMEGFLVWDWRHQTRLFRDEVSAWLRAGRIHYKEDIVDGIAAAPRAFIGLLAGANRGKMLVRVAEASA